MVQNLIKNKPRPLVEDVKPFFLEQYLEMFTFAKQQWGGLMTISKEQFTRLLKQCGCILVLETLENNFVWYATSEQDVPK